MEREAEEGCKHQLKLCQMLGLPLTNGKLARKTCGAWDEPNSRS